MPFLRKIKKSRWDVHPDIRWLKVGELQAVALADLLPTNNRLSLYLVPDGSTGEDVAIALAATGDYVSNLDYCLLTEADLAQVGVAATQTPGQTPDSTVNQRHFDVGPLSAGHIHALTQIVAKAAKLRIQEKKLKQLLVNSIQSGSLERQSIGTQLLYDLGILQPRQRDRLTEP